MLGRLALFAALVWAASSGCDGRPWASERRRDQRLETEALPDGRSVQTLEEVCPGFFRRALEDHRGVLISYATKWDCGRCSTHLANVAAVIERLDLAERALLVIWAESDSQANRLVSSALGSGQTQLAAWPGEICTDTRGVLWDEVVDMPTPLTTLVRDREVVFSTNAPLAMPDEVDRFVQHVSRELVSR